MINRNALILLILVQVTAAAAIADIFGIGWGAVALLMPALPQIYLLIMGMMTAKLLLTVPFFGLAAAAAYGAATSTGMQHPEDASGHPAHCFHPATPAVCRRRSAHVRHVHHAMKRRLTPAPSPPWRNVG